MIKNLLSKNVKQAMLDEVKHRIEKGENEELALYNVFVITHRLTKYISDFYYDLYSVCLDKIILRKLTLL